jgi:acyl-CoA synthetase (AMP-forming)/AMP-acid ligase II
MTPLNAPSSDFAEFSPTAILDAFENFEGSFFDLDRDVQISSDELKKLKTDLRQQMLQRRLAVGDRIIAAVPNGPLFAAICVASLEAGAAPVLVHSETPQPELERLAERSKARFLVAELTVDSRYRPSEFLTAGRHGTLSWQQFKGVGRDQPSFPAVPLHPTSGTSGGPKVAVRPGPCAVAEPFHYIETLAIDRSDVILCAIPMSHAYAYGMCFMVALLKSTDLVFMRRFNPKLVLRALNQMDISIFPAVPMMLDFLLATNAEELSGRPRVLLSAGAALTRTTHEAFRQRYGLSILPLYGTTETGGISIGSAEEEFDGSVGLPMRGVEVDLLESSDMDVGSDARMLRVRSPSMMAGYLEEWGLNRGVLTDGWFETGDLARFDGKGNIHLLGRHSEVINVFGFKVVPREVEEVISMMPEVAEVKVYAGRQRGSDTVEAAVVRRGDVNEDQIFRHCDKHLVNYKSPISIRFVDALPRTASGKVAIECLRSER